MSDPIPGWYPDPEEPSRQRFWDGTRWTEARAYPVAAGLDGLPGPAPQEEERGTNWALVVGLLALLGVVLLAVWFFLLRGGSSEPAPVPTTAPTAPTAVPTAPTKKPTVPPVTPTAPPTAPTVPPTPPTAVPTP